MPGGRGTLLDIASALNEPEVTSIAAAIRMALKTGEYRIQASVPMLAASITKCNNDLVFNELWCYALEHSKVDWVEY